MGYEGPPVKTSLFHQMPNRSRVVDQGIADGISRAAVKPRADVPFQRGIGRCFGPGHPISGIKIIKPMETILNLDFRPGPQRKPIVYRRLDGLNSMLLLGGFIQV